MKTPTPDFSSFNPHLDAQILSFAVKSAHQYTFFQETRATKTKINVLNCDLDKRKYLLLYTLIYKSAKQREAIVAALTDNYGEVMTRTIRIRSQ